MNKQHTNSLDADAVSALADGVLHGDALTETLRQLALDDDARKRWHAYHVVGDVLRSSDLADAAGDLAFLGRLEARLALEPASTMPVPAIAVQSAGVEVVRPSMKPAANNDVFRWKVAAGFASLAAVAAIGWQSLQWQSPSAGAVLAQSSASQSQSSLPSQSQGTSADFQSVSLDFSPAGAPAASQAPPVMLRNAQLDELLAAHSRAVGGAALQSQSRMLRNVSVTEEPGR